VQNNLTDEMQSDQWHLEMCANRTGRKIMYRNMW